MGGINLAAAISEDRQAPLPGAPDPQVTVAVVQRMVADEPRTKPGGRPEFPQVWLWIAFGISGLIVTCGFAWVLAAPIRLHALLVLSMAQLVVLKMLIKEGARS